MKRNIFKRLLAMAAGVMTIMNAQGATVYSTDFVEKPTGATTTINKGSFKTPAVSWASAYANYFQTSGSAGEITINFSPAIDLSGYTNAKLVIYWGATSNRPLNLKINNGTASEVDKVASSADRSKVRTVNVNLSQTSISSLNFKSSGGGNVFLFHLEITGDGGSNPPVTADPTITSFTLAGAAGTIDQSNKTIAVTVPAGTNVTSLTPTIVTNPATATVSPTGAQNFSSAVKYTVSADGKSAEYTVNVTVASATASTDATLSDLKVDGTTVSGFAAATTTYSYTVPATQSALPQVSATANDAKATVNITQTTAMNGSATVKVTAEDGKTTKTYTVNFSQATQPVNPPTTSLSLHQPEVYETSQGLGGYETPLVNYGGREYEVYYVARVKDASGTRKYAFTTQNSGSYVVSDINLSNASETYTKAADGWFEGTSQGMSGNADVSSSSRVGATEEFQAVPAEAKMYNNDELTLHVSGYDRFAIYAKDNNATESKGKHLEVYVDGAVQTMTLSTTASVRAFNLTTGEHVLKVKGVGGSNNYFYAFSLRTANTPQVRYVSGNDSSQVVNQTRSLSPVSYRMKNASQGTWKLAVMDASGNDVTTTSGLSLTTGDTVQIQGQVVLPVGKYTWRISAMSGTTESSYLTGRFSVQTEVTGPDGTTASPITLNANINEAMKAQVFSYDAVDDNDVNATWATTPAGVQFNRDAQANTLTLGGTPTAAGSYGFSITAKGGNTIQGTLNVVYPAPEVTAPDNADARVKDKTALTAITYTLKYATGASATGLPTGVSGSYNAANGTFTISGTPNTGGPYPKTFNYTITATGTSGYSGPAVTATGIITVIDPNAKSVLYLFQGEADSNTPSASNSQADTYLLAALGSNYDIATRQASDKALAASAYAAYDAIVISETAGATNAEVLNVLGNVDKPVLNLLAFAYNSSRMNWGSASNGVDTKVSIVQPGHPIFGSGATVGKTVNILSDVDLRGIQPVDVTLAGTICLATAQKRGSDEAATAIHEIPAAVRHSGFKSRYLLVPISSRSYKYLTAEGKTLLQNALKYVVGETSSNITQPTLQITSFKVGGRSAVIDQAANTITMQISNHDFMLSPEVTLADKDHTSVTPASGTAVDFSHSYAFPVEYVVTDYISTRTYKVTITHDGTALDEASADGLWFDGLTVHNPNGLALYVYDYAGRRIAFCNADIDLSAYPQGLYLIQSPAGTLKAIR